MLEAAGIFPGGFFALAGRTVGYAGPGNRRQYFRCNKAQSHSETLDRGEVSAKTEVEVTARAYETVFEQLDSGSLAAYRACRSTTPALVDDLKALRASDNEPIDAQAVDDIDFDYCSVGDVTDYGQP
jgi:hypothetical protein